MSQAEIEFFCDVFERGALIVFDTADEIHVVGVRDTETLRAGDADSLARNEAGVSLVHLQVLPEPGPDICQRGRFSFAEQVRNRVRQIERLPYLLGVRMLQERVQSRRALGL